MIYKIYIKNKGYVDLPSDFSVTMRYKSQQFCLYTGGAEIESPRTEQFTLPKTENNMKLFQSFLNFGFENSAMNYNYSAQLYMDYQCYDGTLYVASLSEKGFDCVFLYTSTQSQLRAMGLDTKLSTWKLNDYTLYGETAVKAQSAGNNLFKTIKYKSKYNNVLLPAINLKQLLHKCLTSKSCPSSWNTLTLNNGDIWAIIPRVNILPSTISTFARNKNADYILSTSSASVALNNISLTSAISDISMYTESTLQVIYYDEQYLNGTNWNTRRWKGSLVSLKAKMDISITFPEDFPDTLFLATIGGDGLSQSSITFYGEYEFAWTAQGITKSGLPLAKRKVDLPKGTIFTIIHQNDYTYAPEPFNPNIPQTRGWKLADINVTYNVTIESSKDDAVDGDIIRLQDNLPDISIKDLWLSLCAVDGRLGLIYGDELTYINNYKDIIYDASFDIISMTKFEKSCLGLCQKNYIKTKHEKWTNESDYKQLIITNNNKNLELEKVIYEIPFADGSPTRDGVGNSCLELRNASGEECDNHILGKVGNSEYLEQIDIKENNVLMVINSQSKTYQLKVKNLNYKILQLFNNKMFGNNIDYFITEAESKNDIHNITIITINT